MRDSKWMILFHFHIWIVIFLAFRKELELFFQGEKKKAISKLNREKKKICLKKANKIYESYSIFSLVCRWNYLEVAWLIYHLKRIF